MKLRLETLQLREIFDEGILKPFQESDATDLVRKGFSVAAGGVPKNTPLTRSGNTGAKVASSASKAQKQLSKKAGPLGLKKFHFFLGSSLQGSQQLAQTQQAGSSSTKSNEITQQEKEKQAKIVHDMKQKRGLPARPLPKIEHQIITVSPSTKQSSKLMFKFNAVKQVCSAQDIKNIIDLDTNLCQIINDLNNEFKVDPSKIKSKFRDLMQSFSYKSETVNNTVSLAGKIASYSGLKRYEDNFIKIANLNNWTIASTKFDTCRNFRTERNFLLGFNKRTRSRYMCFHG